MNRPDIRELECFVAVAEALNFSKAAKALHLSQPPLTRRIQTLEEKLGSRLFVRDTHSVTLTEAGQLFLEDARTTLRQLDRATDTLRRARRGETVRLRLAFIGALLDENLVHLLQQFRAAHPACQLDVADLAPAAQMAALQAGQLDGGFIGAAPARTPKGIAFTVWNEEPFVLAMPEGHPLSRVEPLEWADLDGLPWVMVSRTAAPAFRQQFSELVEAHRLSARIVQESERLPAVLTMVAAGSGVTLVSASIRRLIASGVTFRELPAPAPRLRHAFAYSAPSAAASPLADFLEELRALHL
ncbi:MAG: LysR substrate-binding domain-containing protein [Chthoniobacteraceae bacterium]